MIDINQLIIGVPNWTHIHLVDVKDVFMLVDPNRKLQHPEVSGQNVVPSSCQERPRLS
jgi:hypothetical protein